MDTDAIVFSIWHTLVSFVPRDRISRCLADIHIAAHVRPNRGNTGPLLCAAVSTSSPYFPSTLRNRVPVPLGVTANTSTQGFVRVKVCQKPCGIMMLSFWLSVMI